MSHNEDNQAVITVPGLAAELNKLNRQYQQIKDQAQDGSKKMGRISNLSQTTKDKDSKNNDSKAFFNIDDINVDVPMSRAQFEEVTAAMKSERKKPSPEFQAVPRSNKLVVNAYLGMKDGQDVAKYRPKEDFLQTTIARNLTIKPEQKTFGKTPYKVPAECVADKR